MNWFKYFLLSMLTTATILTACAPTMPASPASATPAASYTILPPTQTPTPIYVEATASPLPPSPTLPPMITPEAGQVERWQEYQKELAKRVLADGGGIFPAYETAVCEWDILGSSNQDVYVWAQCFAPGSGGSGPAVIHLNTDASVIDVT